MATLTLINNTIADIFLEDVGFVVPVAGDNYTDPHNLLDLALSQSLRDRLTAGDITANDGTVNLGLNEAFIYLSALWARAGRDEISALRLAASGTTVIPPGAMVDLATFTRNPQERIQLLHWANPAVAGLGWGEGGPLGLPDSIELFYERTAVPDQAKARAKNNNLLAARTIDWAVMLVRT